MNMISRSVLAAAATLALAGAAHAADIVGAASPATDAQLYIKVGASEVNGGPHTAGKAGIGVGTVSNAKPVDFQGLSSYSVPTTVNGVTVRTLAMPITGTPGNHSGMGHFNFVKVGSGDVWFGEWSKDGAAGGFNNRQVYFAGDRAGTTLPSGTATYAVAGLNKFNGSNLLSGTFVANFGNGTLVGGLSGGGQTLSVNAAINSADASFAGSAVANGSVNGSSKGQFFGANAAALAGIATFAGNSQYDTAFGGTKN
ncbi:Slam-dependent surface lipoprotein [Stenotrophomonas sp. 24(2023)]|uniref:Slam-dependent surface lipoprotein n=1 Tax=Stenotrophomonas sp. 24(2023) TaxID=3068324 RepID=UPI0027E12E5C|nr:Slam-dependent surface lipoprotein [Stenotrophomonas sp. 24(2023)]WMJ69382.1 Slam-dependent surface lipoprotein [Stenotrophomonas sp. 24(2023)]